VGFMLVPTRREGQEVIVGDSIRITVVKCKHGRVSLGIDAPDSPAILRAELWGGPPRLTRKPAPGPVVRPVTAAH
jgi:carbon storage regulator CsrA